MVSSSGYQCPKCEGPASLAVDEFCSPVAVWCGSGCGSSTLQECLDACDARARANVRAKIRKCRRCGKEKALNREAVASWLGKPFYCFDCEYRRLQLEFDKQFVGKARPDRVTGHAQNPHAMGWIRNRETHIITGNKTKSYKSDGSICPQDVDPGP